ncbi:hypothetical protein EV1_031860 [Malus domestica]
MVQLDIKGADQCQTHTVNFCIPKYAFATNSVNGAGTGNRFRKRPRVCSRGQKPSSKYSSGKSEPSEVDSICYCIIKCSKDIWHWHIQIPSKLCRQQS